MVRRDSGDVTVKRVFEPRLDYARGVTTLMLLGEGVQTRGVWQTLSLIASVPTRLLLRSGAPVSTSGPVGG